MSTTNGLLTIGKHLLQRQPLILQQKAWLNARRKALRTRWWLEPGRRMSAYFKNPNSHPGLLNGPDYTFLDNRPTPYGFGQYKRICNNITQTAAIIQCNKEIDLAFKLEEMEKKHQEVEIQKVLDRKLIAKGGKIEVTSKEK